MDPYSRRFTWEVIRSRRSAFVTLHHPSETTRPPGFIHRQASEMMTPFSSRIMPARPAIILTTHSMEEAEALADDVVIMADGHIAAMGTPMQLKQKYGVGYTLTLDVETSPSPDIGQGASLHPASDDPPEENVTTLGDSSTTVIALSSLVKRHVPSAVLLKATGVTAKGPPHPSPSSQFRQQGGESPGSSPPSASAGDISFRLPKECTSSFPPLLRELQSRGKELGVLSYGLSETTLEEVFHAITLQAQYVNAVRNQQSCNSPSDSKPNSILISGGPVQDNANPSSPRHRQPSQSKTSPTLPVQDIANPSMRTSPLPTTLSGLALWRQRFKALFLKRVLLASRDSLAVITQLLVPLLLVHLSLWVQILSVRSPIQPPLLLSRAVSLRGNPGALSASAATRGQAGGGDLTAFVQGYQCIGSSSGGALYDTGTSGLYQGDGSVLQDCLEDWLLGNWHSGQPVYDAVFVHQLPAKADNISGSKQGRLRTFPSNKRGHRSDESRERPSLLPPLRALLEDLHLVILVNQSAVHALPTSLNQASTAILR